VDMLRHVVQLACFLLHDGCPQVVHYRYHGARLKSATT
jgi:hypothetical protein